MMLSGLLVLDKPSGIRSTECVEICQKILGRGVRVGHAGTLDSPASGILVILLGEATRLSRFIMALPKVYEVEIKLGVETTTDDSSGIVLRKSDWEGITCDTIDRMIPSFLGTRLQIPPLVSAVHIDGVRSYQLAHAGCSFLPKPRPTTITKILRRTGISFPEGEVGFWIFCHKGTYIRSFARDLGKKLGCGAHVRYLRRLSVGPFTVSGKPVLNSFSKSLTREALLGSLLPIEEALRSFTSYRTSEVEAAALLHGRSIPFCMLSREHWGVLPSSKGLIVKGPESISICEMDMKEGAWVVQPRVNLSRSCV